ncbi:MAG: hypothetical protein E7235_06565 [Lachnospiraceae bacterium]|nr:hypothetical protein [Lachnospiraceae bacterium]
MTKYGFKLIKEDYIEDLKGSCLIYEHTSGAKLCNLKNDDENKVFYIAFRTPPENDCGIPHIIEHSVLCGSKKFCVKDPFNELSKSSLNTYLNAVTFKDKTVYPVASTNDKDFFNLISVYMDAVFNPLIGEKKEIFMQEGIHIHKEKDKEPCFKGVVYNEMKGSYSDPERLLDKYIFRMIFPEDYYRYDSGGVPEDIRKLTYEQFMDFYKRHYTPQNSYIYFYGDADIDEYMEFIDREYLSKCEKTDYIPPMPSENVSVTETFFRGKYPLAEDDGRSSYFTANFVAGKSTDYERCEGLDILSYILAGNSSSPLTAALVKNGICDNVVCWSSSSIYNVVFTIMAENADTERFDDFKQIVEDTIKDILENGFDKELVESTLSALEFSVREADFGSTPKGLIYGFSMASSWMNGGEAKPSFEMIKTFESIKNKAKDGYFEQLLKEMAETKAAYVVMDPDTSLNDSDSENKELEEVYSAFTDEYKEKVEKETEALLSYQSEPEDPEEIAKIPYVDISEISEDIKFDSCEEEDGVIATEIDTDGISYLRLMFDTSSIPMDKLAMLGVFNIILGEAKAGDLTYERLPIEINMNIGSFDTGLSAFNLEGNKVYRVYDINARFITEKAEKVFALLKKIILETEFDDKDDIRKILQEAKTGIENSLLNSGHETVMNRSLSYISKSACYGEKTSGVEVYDLIKNILDNYDEGFDKFRNELISIRDTVFVKNGMRIHIAAEKDDIDKVKGHIKALKEALKEGTGESYDIVLPEIKKEAFTTDGMVAYNGKAANYVEIGYEYDGSLSVLKTIINREFLWNTVRIKGGAYGCGLGITRNGNMFMYSYRDPNIGYTYDAYNSIGDFIRSFECDKKLMDRYIIGTISVMDRPKSKAVRAKEALMKYILGITYEMSLKDRKSILTADIEKIKRFDKLFDEVAKMDYICTVGGRDLVDKSGMNFEKVVPLIK